LQAAAERNKLFFPLLFIVTRSFRPFVGSNLCLTLIWAKWNLGLEEIAINLPPSAVQILD